MPRHDAFAITAPGLAPLVARELERLGIASRETSDAGVAFDATDAELFAANLRLRTASRVIVRLARFDVRDFATLEKLSTKVPWARVLPPGARAALRVTCRKSRLYHSDAVAERVARGIERSVKGADATARASEEDDDGEDTLQRFIVRIDHDVCTISADASGALLHRRGWRQAVAKAPLRETLAAAMLDAAGWDGTEALVDPFCGSGTIGIEAALRARNVAPGLGRSFAMERWPTFDAKVAREAREAARDAVRRDAQAPIVIADRDAGAVEAARANAERAGVLDALVIDQRALSSTDLAAIAPRGLLLTNPPYGLRVSEGADLRGLYARLGDVVRAGGRDWRLALLVPDRRPAGQTRLALRPVLRTTNGGVPVELLATSAASPPASS